MITSLLPFCRQILCLGALPPCTLLFVIDDQINRNEVQTLIYLRTTTFQDISHRLQAFFAPQID